LLPFAFATPESVQESTKAGNDWNQALFHKKFATFDIKALLAASSLMGSKHQSRI
jgi:hypothetical protein